MTAKLGKPVILLAFRHLGSDYRLVWIPKQRGSDAHGVVEVRYVDALGEAAWRNVQNLYPPRGDLDRDDTSLQRVILHKLIDRVRRGRA